MDQQKFVELQYQMKQNNEELQDFLRDLDSWESDIKSKEKELMSQEKKTSEVQWVDSLNYGFAGLVVDK